MRDDYLAAMTAPPPHPGTILRDIVLPDCGCGLDEAAGVVGLAPDRFAGLLDGGVAITPEIADGIARLAGGRPGIWVRMQETHDAWHRSRAGAA